MEATIYCTWHCKSNKGSVYHAANGQCAQCYAAPTGENTARASFYARDEDYLFKWIDYHIEQCGQFHTNFLRLVSVSGVVICEGEELAKMYAQGKTLGLVATNLTEV